MDGTNLHINNKPYNSACGIVMFILTVNNRDLPVTIETATFQIYKGSGNK